jgi:hypothetical protein
LTLGKSDSVKICLAMEEAESGAEAKAKSLMRFYADCFSHITYTIHPVGVPGEARGKSSNVSYAARVMVSRAGSLF